MPGHLPWDDDGLRKDKEEWSSEPADFAVPHWDKLLRATGDIVQSSIWGALQPFETYPSQNNARIEEPWVDASPLEQLKAGETPSKDMAVVLCNVQRHRRGQLIQMATDNVAEKPMNLKMTNFPTDPFPELMYDANYCALGKKPEWLIKKMNFGRVAGSHGATLQDWAQTGKDEDDNV